MPASPILLGIETSCDDTAAAVVSNGKLVSSVISSQEGHAAFGGVVPELASRAHQKRIVPIVKQALDDADIDRKELEAIAVTRGPGLAGSLLVGLSFAKSLALGLDIPVIGINHLEGHIYSLFIGDNHPAFPFLCLIVSGGHTQLMRVDTGFKHTILGRTRDDAAGEAFDKVAKLLNLEYPGGPVIEQLATSGDASFHEFPRTFLPGFDFSFSGIKTSVLYYLNSFSEEVRAQHIENHLEDICASFQEAIVDMLATRVKKALRKTGIKNLAVVGGVSANSVLQDRLTAVADSTRSRFFVPDPVYCTDNAAMIAIAGHHKLIAGETSPDSLTIAPSLSVL